MKKSFENLYIWKEAKYVFLQLYAVFTDKSFKEYYFRDQILRATLSISNNIAEWYERVSKKEEKVFLWYAKWSCWEVRSMMLIAWDLWYVSWNQKDTLLISLKKISAWIHKMIIS